MRTVRRRFWVEAVAAAVTAVTLVGTAVWPNWVERLWDVEPDGGDGSLEWALVGVLAAVTVTLALAARAEWTRESRLTPP